MTNADASTPDVPTRDRPGRDLRRVVLALTIGSFSIAALLGLIALLGGGEFGGTQARVLLTTLTVGVASVAVLCCLATDDSPYSALGVLGGVVILWPTAQSLVAIWASGSDLFGDTFFKTYGVGLVLAFTLAQACLLLGVAHDKSRLRGLLAATLAAAGALAVVVCVEIVAEDGSWWRVMGVLGIIDALGTVVTVAMARFGRGSSSETGDSPPSGQLVLSEELSGRVRALAAERGLSPEEVVLAAVLRDIDPPTGVV